MATITVKRSVSFVQATRTEPARKVEQFLCLTPVGAVCCPTMADVEKLAADFKAELVFA